MTVCSTEFEKLGEAQAAALGYPGLPLAIVPHPFGILPREQVATIAERCAGEVSRHLAQPRPAPAR
ncbi:MAG: hypothetical protein HY329_07000 [Chloroflexi bacterium]|nr:hypothetical protein [Chloroflexota bacterium]